MQLYCIILHKVDLYTTTHFLLLSLYIYVVRLMASILEVTKYSETNITCMNTHNSKSVNTNTIMLH
jgi:hypothetical protein